MLDLLNAITGLVLSANIAREARASITLDGETQSFPVANARAFIRMPDGSLKSELIHDPSMPQPAFVHPGTGEARCG